MELINIFCAIENSFPALQLFEKSPQLTAKVKFHDLLSNPVYGPSASAPV